MKRLLGHVQAGQCLIRFFRSVALQSLARRRSVKALLGDQGSQRVQRLGHQAVYAHFPRCSRVKMPASTRIFRWCDTVGWDSPTGSISSQTQASLFWCPATSEISRSQVGSARALKPAAKISASAGGIS